MVSPCFSNGSSTSDVVALACSSSLEPVAGFCGPPPHRSSRPDRVDGMIAEHGNPWHRWCIVVLWAHGTVPHWTTIRAATIGGATFKPFWTKQARCFQDLGLGVSDRGNLWVSGLLPLAFSHEKDHVLIT